MLGGAVDGMVDRIDPYVAGNGGEISDVAVAERAMAAGDIAVVTDHTVCDLRKSPDLHVAAALAIADQCGGMDGGIFTQLWE